VDFVGFFWRGKIFLWVFSGWFGRGAVREEELGESREGIGKRRWGLDGIGLRYCSCASTVSGQMAATILTSPSEILLLLVASESVPSQAQVIYIWSNIHISNWPAP